MRFPRLLSRAPVDADRLAARCAAADRLVAQRVAALARAGERHVVQPDSADVLAALEVAEELLFIAEYEQRKARAELRRARKRKRFARSADEPARTTHPRP